MALIVSDKACAVLTEILAQAPHEVGQVLRLVHDQSGNLGLAIDGEQSEDHLVECNGVKTLAVMPQLSESLSGVMLDTQPGPAGDTLYLAV